MQASALHQHVRRTADAMVAELRLVGLRGDRVALCAQTVASVVLAVCLADVFQLKQRWWVALSAYVLIRADPGVVFRRSLERLVGTVIGAFGGLLLAMLVSPHAWLVVVALALVAGLGIYGMLGSPYAYSWVLGTVTALMVLGDAATVASLSHFALGRILDVAVGVLATAVVSAAALIVARLLRGGIASAPAVFPASESATSSAELLRSMRIAQAVQGAFAIAVLGVANQVHTLPNVAQSMVSVVAVLLVPASVLMGGHVATAVHVRMFNRLLGCLCAALLAAPLLPLIGHVPVLCLAVLGAGVWLAAHVQAGSAQVSYIGTQFGVGFIMIFVQDRAWSTDPSAALQRLLGIIGALVVLAATMAVFSVLGRKVSAAGGSDV
jgi:uncharacterized membrane protein YccC